MTDPQSMATLTLPNKSSVELPVYQASLGNDVIDISGLNQAKMFTFDYGFMCTAACESKITYIDGAKGILLYRGYPIEQLAKHCDYMDVCHLLLHTELPTTSQKTAFTHVINERMVIDQAIYKLFQGFPTHAHPMAMLSSIVSALSAYYYPQWDIRNPEQLKNASYDIVAKMPMLAAMCYKHSQGESPVLPEEQQDYIGNFMHMLFSTPDKPWVQNPIIKQAIDRIFILHADHEQNASTATVRLAGSTGTHPFAAIAAGIAALWGPSHGGANEAALNMLKEIGDISRIEHYLKRAKDPQDPFRLMGFGHRVYKNMDPRAAIMRETCHAVLKEVNATEHPLFELALELERIASQDEYFIERKLYPNVDFYSGITQTALGIPPNLFTVIFALARTVGWAAQWHEMISHAKLRIGRPRQLYTGPQQRNLPSGSRE